MRSNVSFSSISYQFYELGKENPVKALIKENNDNCAEGSEDRMAHQSNGARKILITVPILNI